MALTGETIRKLGLLKLPELASIIAPNRIRLQRRCR